MQLHSSSPWRDSLLMSPTEYKDDPLCNFDINPGNGAIPLEPDEEVEEEEGSNDVEPLEEEEPEDEQPEEPEQEEEN